MAAPTNSQLLDLYKGAMAAIATGQSYTINGRSLTRADISEVRETIEWLEQRVAAETNTNQDGTGIVLARFNRGV